MAREPAKRGVPFQPLPGTPSFLSRPPPAVPARAHAAPDGPNLVGEPLLGRGRERLSSSSQRRPSRPDATGRGGTPSSFFPWFPARQASIASGPPSTGATQRRSPSNPATRRPRVHHAPGVLICKCRKGGAVLFPPFARGAAQPSEQRRGLPSLPRKTRPDVVLPRVYHPVPSGKGLPFGPFSISALDLEDGRAR